MSTLLYRKPSKGNRVQIPEPGYGYLAPLYGGASWIVGETLQFRYCGNANELGDVGGSPGKSFLFFLTDCIAPKAEGPGIRLSGDRAQSPAKHYTSRGVRCALDGP